MSLLALPTDLFKLILDWLPLRTICLSAAVCRRFASNLRTVLKERALRGRTVDPQLSTLHQLLEPKLKTWEYYLLLRLAFYEVEEDSIRLTCFGSELSLAIYQNRLDLVEKWTPLAYQYISSTKDAGSVLEATFYGLVELCTIYSRTECFLTLLQHWKTLPTKPRKFPPLIPVGFLSLFNDKEKKAIVERLKCPPITLYLARKGPVQIQLNKLTPSQQLVAFDCYPEEKLDLLKFNPRLRNWAYYRLRCQKGQILRSCQFDFKWRNLPELLDSFYRQILKEKEINYKIPIPIPEWCLEYEIDDCHKGIIRHVLETSDPTGITDKEPAKIIADILLSLSKLQNPTTSERANKQKLEQVIRSIIINPSSDLVLSQRILLKLINEERKQIPDSESLPEEILILELVERLYPQIFRHAE
jgi:hypothetical protein